MRLIHFDIDTLRADHLGCYGYLRNTSPNIDAIAASGVRFDRVYASDTPCLPSRSALVSGQFGVHNGAVNHGGRAAEPFSEGSERRFRSAFSQAAFPMVMRYTGMWTCTISTFAERHAAYHWYAGFNESLNVGRGGLENADHVAELAIDWLQRNAGRHENWYLHVHLWDPHTPYRVPEDYGDPFRDEPVDDWITEEVRAEHWTRPGPHSAQEMTGFAIEPWAPMFPRQPTQASDLDQVRRMFDGYDTGVRYADDHIGRVMNVLADLGLEDDTAVMVSSDHGETLGELGVYCDHHTADEQVTHLPMVLRFPGVEGATGGAVQDGLQYQIDVAATVVNLLGARVPSRWDGVSFADELRRGEQAGRQSLVLSHAAWTAQRSVRFDDWLCMFTYHDGFHGFPDVMLFDVAEDPHEQHDLAEKRPDVVERAGSLLMSWLSDAMLRSSSGMDPLWTVVQEGGPYHVRGKLRKYMDRLRETGRGHHADVFEATRARDLAIELPPEKVPARLLVPPALKQQ